MRRTILPGNPPSSPPASAEDVIVDPRFNLVTPNGRAPTWNQMGNGNWASSST